MDIRFKITVIFLLFSISIITYSFKKNWYKQNQMRKIFKLFFIIFLPCSLIYQNTYSEEKKFSYDRYKK